MSFEIETSYFKKTKKKERKRKKQLIWDLLLLEKQ